MKIKLAAKLESFLRAYACLGCPSGVAAHPPPPPGAPRTPLWGWSRTPLRVHRVPPLRPGCTASPPWAVGCRGQKMHFHWEFPYKTRLGRVLVTIFPRTFFIFFSTFFSHFWHRFLRSFGPGGVSLLGMATPAGRWPRATHPGNTNARKGTSGSRELADLGAKVDF